MTGEYGRGEGGLGMRDRDVVTVEQMLRLMRRMARHDGKVCLGRLEDLMAKRTSIADACLNYLKITKDQLESIDNVIFDGLEFGELSPITRRRVRSLS